MKELLRLFAAFAKVGVATFGGGAAMLPILQRELVESRDWVSEDDLADYYAISQCLPGLIAVNMAVLVGRQRKGVLGGVFAAAGVVLPSLLIILVLANLISTVDDVPWVQNAFAGIRACVCVQIFNAVLKLGKRAVVDLWTGALLAAIFLAALLTPLSPVWLVLLAALAGVSLQALGVRKGGQA